MQDSEWKGWNWYEYVTCFELKWKSIWNQINLMHQCESTSIYELTCKKHGQMKLIHDNFGRPEHSMVRASYRAVSSNMLHTVKRKCPLRAIASDATSPHEKTWGYSRVSKIVIGIILRKKIRIQFTQRLPLYFQGIGCIGFNWITRNLRISCLPLMMVDLDIQLLGGRILTSAPVACTLPCVPPPWSFPNFFRFWSK